MVNIPVVPVVPVAAVHVPGAVHMVQNHMEHVVRHRVQMAIMWKIAHVSKMHQHHARTVNTLTAIHVQIVPGYRIMPLGPVLEQRQQIAHGNAMQIIIKAVHRVLRVMYRFLIRAM